jgi:hypothetical protein
VPVWTSQLLAAEWLRSEPMPVTARLVPLGMGFRLEVTNHLNRPLTDVRVAFQDRLHTLGPVAANAAARFTLEPQLGEPLASFVQRQASGWPEILGQRRQAFGENARWITPSSSNVIATSFLSQLPGPGPNQRLFLTPAGLDLSPLVERGDALLFAWDGGHAPIPSFRQFPAVRSQQNTLYRLAVPVGPVGAP